VQSSTFFTSIWVSSDMPPVTTTTSSSSSRRCGYDSTRVSLRLRGWTTSCPIIFDNVKTNK
jgi:hypothetical protein